MFSLLCNYYWLFLNFDTLYFSTDGCINKSLTYLLTYLMSYLQSKLNYHALRQWAVKVYLRYVVHHQWRNEVVSCITSALVYRCQNGTESCHKITVELLQQLIYFSQIPDLLPNNSISVKSMISIKQNEICLYKMMQTPFDGWYFCTEIQKCIH